MPRFTLILILAIGSGGCTDLFGPERDFWGCVPSKVRVGSQWGVDLYERDGYTCEPDGRWWICERPCP